MTRIAPSGFTVKQWRPSQKNNSLRAFFSLEIPSGIILHSLALHEREGRRWLSMPAKPFTEDGATVWVAQIEFASSQARSEFQDAAIAAVDAYLAEARS
jgi:hypothetical protein